MQENLFSHFHIHWENKYQAQNNPADDKPEKDFSEFNYFIDQFFNGKLCGDFPEIIKSDGYEYTRTNQAQMRYVVIVFQSFGTHDLFEVSADHIASGNDRP